MTKSGRLALIVLAAAAVSTAALASLPVTKGPAPEVRRRLRSPRDCCAVDLDMCPRQTPGPRQTLNHAQVLAVIKRQGDTARSCLSSTTPSAKVRFEIDAGGSAHRVVVRDQVPGEVAACLTRAVASWRFPATERGLDVPVSFRFERSAP